MGSSEPLSKGNPSEDYYVTSQKGGYEREEAYVVWLGSRYLQTLFPPIGE
jgi:hypothetical protein